MLGTLRKLAAIAALCGSLALSPAPAAAHNFDPFDPRHTHERQADEDGGASTVVVVVVLMMGTAGGLIALRRVGKR